MTRDLSRLLRPKSIAVVGGGAWCHAVIAQCRKMGFQGPIWPVHPRASEVEGLPAYASVTDLPCPPDATFIGVNREATIDIVATLSTQNAGGAVCFASGFSEAVAEDASSAGLQADLLKAAGDMPILGPNCYGFINYLDGALLWPDQHGGQRCNKGVALITQSSNIAINLTMQNRAVPLAYVVTAGNQAQCGLSDIAMSLLDDPRVTALGLHIEGIGDLRAFEALAAKARDLNKPIVALKVGRSAQARAATISHTASLAGEDAGADALLRRLGVMRAFDLPCFLETLKLLHTAGRLPQNTIATISCSGGEASLAADTGHDLDVTFPPLTDTQQTNLRDALGPRVALANPLDYHTYIWRDVAAMTRAFAAMADPGIALTILIVDFPRADLCDPSDWDCAIEATINAAQQTGSRYAMAATLPELMPEEVAQRLMRAGITPFNGLSEALSACALAAEPAPPDMPPLHLPGPEAPAVLVAEAEAKHALSETGVPIPKSVQCRSPQDIPDAATALGCPVVVKGEGIAHKTEANAVALNLATPEAAQHAAESMPTESFLVEQMITDTVCELLIGVVRDPAHGFVLTLGAGGTLTELLGDSTSLLVPAPRDSVEQSLNSLKVAKLLHGYRGKPGADIPAVLDAIMAVQNYVIAHSDGLSEIEINPLLCTPTGAMAADALLRRAE